MLLCLTVQQSFCSVFADASSSSNNSSVLRGSAAACQMSGYVR